MAWLYKRSGSAKWWIGYRVNGRQVLRSTGTSDHAAAKKELAKIETMFSAQQAGALTDELFRELTGKTKPQATLRGQVDEWLTEARGATAQGTAESYTAAAEEFVGFLRADAVAMKLADVTPEHVRGYLAAVRARSSAATANQRRKLLSILFQRCIRAGVTRDNPCVQVRAFRLDRDAVAARLPFTIEEARLLHRKADEFWRYAIEGALSTGLRLGDLATLPWGAVDLDEWVVRVRARKTGKLLTIPLRSSFASRLMDLRRDAEKKGTGDHVWPAVARRYLKQGAGSLSPGFHALLVECGLAEPRTHKAAKGGRGGRRKVAELSFHCLRHTFVSLLKITGGSQAVAKELAGHSSDAVNDAYTHTPLPQLRAAIDALPEVAE